MLTRFPDWQARLHCFLAGNTVQPFRYGSFDCCLAVCGAIQAMTGTDLAEEFRGRYSTALQARRAMRDLTGSPSVRAVVERAANNYGMDRIPPMQAQRGDMILMKRKRDYSLALVDLNGRDLIVATAEGLAKFPLFKAAALLPAAWRV